MNDNKIDNSSASGYALERIYCPRQFYETLPLTDESIKEQGEIMFSWDWRVIDRERFEIMLGVGIEPSRKKPMRLDLLLVGTFRVFGAAQSVGVLDFVKLQGPALIMPYLRETVSSLTHRGPFEPMYLAPMNVHKLMISMNPDESVGAAQLSGGTPLPAGKQIADPSQATGDREGTSP